MERYFKLPKTTFIGGPKEKCLKLREILTRLERVYCSSIGVEYMYITSVEQLNFIREKLEPPGSGELPKRQKLILMARLIRATM